MTIFCNYALAQHAPCPWPSPSVNHKVSENVLYVPISDSAVTVLSICENHEQLFDLLEINNSRIKPMATFNAKYTNTYEDYSKVRLGVYNKLLVMLEYLPDNVGIAYFEGFRPLYKQKEYFDNKFKEILQTIPDKERAYQETSKHVSPFINNIPPHTTGAAIDMTLFSIDEHGHEQLIDMGKFDVIFGPNDQQETFSTNITDVQRNNRMILLEAATFAGLVNYGFEWWHYSYGDKMWAVVKKQAHALYGLAVLANDPILSIDKQAYLDSF